MYPKTTPEIYGCDILGKLVNDVSHSLDPKKTHDNEFSNYHNNIFETLAMTAISHTCFKSFAV